MFNNLPKTNAVLPRWAPRVDPQLIRRLYLSDARGLLDEELLEEVSYGLYCRCQSIRDVTGVYDGKVTCPVCHTIIPLDPNIKIGPTSGYDKEAVLHCPQCTWSCRYGDYHATFQGKNLRGHNFFPLVEEYLRQQPLAQSHAEKMLLIDRLIHAVHQGTLKGAAVSFVEGRSATQLRRFLDALAYGDASTAGMAETKQQWDVAQEGYEAGWRGKDG